VRLCGLAIAYVLVAAGPAGAQEDTGGAAMPPPEAAVPSVPPARSPVELRALRCLEGCAESGAVRAGSVIRVKGRRLGRTAEVLFLGAEGDADDFSAKPAKRTRRYAEVRVPLGAASGVVTILDRDGAQADPVPEPLAVEPQPAALRAAGPSVELQVRAPRAFFDAVSPARLLYVLHGDSPASVGVELVRLRDGAVVTRWDFAGVPPDTPQEVAWDGMVDGQLQPGGRYAFRIAAQDASGAVARSAQAEAEPAPDDPAAFRFLRHVFPVRGAHGFGEFAARFGGGRGHQGQDIFAECGTPLVAARGGVVKFKRYHSRAGHYLIVDGARTGVDYAYMHLREPALVEEGDRVRTGQPIGFVGDTGRAHGCHLHFEMWSAPGWYTGGAPFDPLPDLLGWDRRS
jgi:murein DD-endopeptidase MepM/ murein hydrolase activator NlpD